MGSIGYIRDKTIQVFVRGDLTTVRALLAAASFIAAVALLLPLHTFERPAYAWLKKLGPEWCWGLAFAVHVIGTAWRICDPRPRRFVGFGIQSLGIALWIYSVAGLTFAVGELSPGIGAEVSLIVASIVALKRTGLNDEITTP